MRRLDLVSVLYHCLGCCSDKRVVVKELGYARGYAYNPEYAYVYDGFAPMRLLMDCVTDIRYTMTTFLSNLEGRLS
jgi:hypothetical protein